MGKQKKCEACLNKQDETKFTKCNECVEFTNKTIINGLLTYVNTYFTRSAPMQIKLAISAHFGDNAVESAKTTMVNIAEELELEIGDAAKDRQNSINRSSKEANIDDILYIFRTMDTSDIEDRKKPVFCAADLTELPTVSPETGSNALSLYEILAKQEKTIQDLINSMTSVQAEVAALRNRPVRSFASVATVDQVSQSHSFVTPSITAGLRADSRNDAVPSTSTQDQRMPTGATQGTRGTNDAN